MDLKRGELIGIVGRNGSGKSTFLDVLSGLLQTHTGRVEIEGDQLKKVIDLDSENGKVC